MFPNKIKKKEPDQFAHAAIVAFGVFVEFVPHLGIDADGDLSVGSFFDFEFFNGALFQGSPDNFGDFFEPGFLDKRLQGFGNVFVDVEGKRAGRVHENRGDGVT